MATQRMCSLDTDRGNVIYGNVHNFLLYQNQERKLSQLNQLREHNESHAQKKQVLNGKMKKMAKQRTSAKAKNNK